MLKVENLSKSFADRAVVKALSFEIKAGESFGLLGPNGAGKTTTIRMLVGALSPDQGQITVNGQPLSAGFEVRRRIGVAPQALSLYEALSARENLEFFAKLYGLRGAQLKQRCDWALDFADLASRQDDLVGTFSGGMQRRLNLACAMVHDPAVIFLDEPTVGVDPQSREHLFRSIEEAKANGKTLLYTTHTMEAAQRLCDRIAIMDHGEFLALGAVDELIDQHGGEATLSGELPLEFQSQLERPTLTWSGPRFQFQSAEPVKALAELAELDLPFRSLQIRRANLESVFFALTGRSLRDS